MVFWIGACLIALAAAAATGWRLIRKQARPAWPTAAGFALASLAAFGAAMQATIASLEAPPPRAATASRTAAPAPHAAAPDGGAGANAEFDSLVARLESSLKNDPEDASRWALLGRSYLAMGRMGDAVRAFKQAVERTAAPDAGLLGEYGEALAAAAGGRVAGEPEAAFARVLTLWPGDPRARYYLAMARAEKGDLAGARQDLAALLASAPADAPWRATVFERLQEMGGDPEAVAPAPATAAAAAGPTADQVRAAEAMSPDDRRQMIRGMVDGLAARLAETPDDLQGWRRLANAYRVLGEPAKSADALAGALELAPDDVDLLVQFAEARLAADGGVVRPATEAALKRADAKQPGNPQILWRLGQAAADRGDTARAGELWREALPKLIDGDPLKAEVQAALAAL